MSLINPNRASYKEYKELFDTYFYPLCSFAFKFLNDYEASKDVVQEVFIRIWNKNISFKEDKVIKSYLYTSVRNKSLDVLKSSSYRLSTSLSQSDIKILESESYFSRELIVEESSRLINEAINTLPYKCKQIIKLSLSGYKNDEISQELSISINTVKAQKRIAYSKLRVMLKGSFSLIAYIFIDL